MLGENVAHGLYGPVGVVFRDAALRHPATFITPIAAVLYAKQAALTRAVQAMRKAHHLGLLQGAIVGIGNAPTALIELVRLIREEGVRNKVYDDATGKPIGKPTGRPSGKASGKASGQAISCAVRPADRGLSVGFMDLYDRREEADIRFNR